jgi:plasmid stabilization system protein ParE
VSFRVRISPEAEQQVRELENWWAANRPAARTTFKEAFSALVGHISRMPGIGRPCDDIQLPGLRRLLMEGTPYAVFYRVDHETTEVFIAAVWSRARGSSPQVR